MNRAEQIIIHKRIDYCFITVVSEQKWLMNCHKTEMEVKNKRHAVITQNTINDKLVCKLMCCIKLTILKLIIFSLTTDPDVLHSSYTTAICCLLKNAYLHPCPVEVVMSLIIVFGVFSLIALTMLFLSTAVVFLV